MSAPQNIYTPKDVYDCDGVRFEFPVTFAVDRPNDVYVFAEKADGTRKRMVRNLDYTIRDESGALTVVTRVDDRRPPIPAGYVIVLQCKMPFTQPSGKAQISPRVFSNRIDSLTRIYRQLREKLDRTLHVGLGYPPFFKTSEPYPIVVADTLSVTSGAKSSTGLFRAIVDYMSFVSIPSGGTLFITLKQYLLWPIEQLSVVSIPSSGDNRLALLHYDNWPTEKLSAVSIPSSGNNRLALLGYNNYPIEKISVVSIPSSGSLS